MNAGRKLRAGIQGIQGRAGRVDPFDVRLEDDELLDEVELTANLIVAANQSEARMSVTEIDEILGVFPTPAQGRLRFPPQHVHPWHSDIAAESRSWSRRASAGEPPR